MPDQWSRDGKALRMSWKWWSTMARAQVTFREKGKSLKVAWVEIMGDLECQIRNLSYEFSWDGNVCMWADTVSYIISRLSCLLEEFELFRAHHWEVLCEALKAGQLAPGSGGRGWILVGWSQWENQCEKWLSLWHLWDSPEGRSGYQSAIAIWNSGEAKTRDNRENRESSTDKIQSSTWKWKELLVKVQKMKEDAESTMQGNIRVNGPRKDVL